MVEVSEKLLPCPFCGDVMEWTGHFVRHVNYETVCPIRGDGFVSQQIWNTRTTLTTENAALAARVEAVEQIARDALDCGTALDPRFILETIALAGDPS